MRTFDLLVAAFALVQCARYGRGAVLFLWPRVRVSGAAGTPAGAARLRAGEALQALGFEPLGTVRERGPLGALAREADAYASAAHRAYADVRAGSAGAPATITLFTPFPGGASVLTADHRRRSVADARTQVGALPDAPLAAVLAAHGVAVDRFAARHGPPRIEASLDGRLAAARDWYDGEGRRELRAGHVVPFVITFVSALVAASAVNILLRAPR